MCVFLSNSNLHTYIITGSIHRSMSSFYGLYTVAYAHQPGNNFGACSRTNHVLQIIPQYTRGDIG